MIIGTQRAPAGAQRSKLCGVFAPTRLFCAMVMGLLVLTLKIGPETGEETYPASALKSVVQLNAAAAGETKTQDWRIVVAAGSVRHRPLGSSSELDWRTAVSGDYLPAGVEIETGLSSHVLLTNGGDSITLQESSRIALPLATEAGVTLVLQDTGKAFYEVESRRAPSGESGELPIRPSPAGLAGGRFEVQTRYLVAVVKGTGFGVSVDDEGASVSVTEGTVGVTDSSTGESGDVSAGQTASAGTSSGTGGASAGVGADSAAADTGDDAGGASSGGDGSGGGSGGGGSGGGGSGGGGSGGGGGAGGGGDGNKGNGRGNGGGNGTGNEGNGNGPGNGNGGHK